MAFLAFLLQLSGTILVLFLRKKINFWVQKGVGLLFSLTFFMAGYLITTFDYHHPFQNSNAPKFNENKFQIAEIVEPIQEREKSVKLIVSINHQKRLLYLKKDSRTSQLKAGDRIETDISFKPIDAPKNPDCFDYRTFMARKGISLTGYGDSTHWNKGKLGTTFRIKWIAYNLQQKLSQILQNSGLKGSEYQVASAILLGNDDTMEPELKTQYSNAGVSHILCVSGMHVGIIFMIINVLLAPLDQYKKSRFLKTLILLLVIWIYAAITGLSPSVIRSATMFTFVLIGEILKRKTNIFQSLFASLFILLIINPLLLFDLGFQLSYLAVFGIVIFQKPISTLFNPKNKIVAYFWSLTSVSVAAQLSTFPISIFYFHQFPNYFLLANLLVIFLSFCIMIGGIVVIVFSIIPTVSSFLGWILTYLVRLMNLIIEWIQSLPGSVTEHISCSFFQMVLLYFLIFFSFATWKWKKKLYFQGILITLLCFFLISNVRHYNNQNLTEMVIFSVPNNMLILFKSGEKSYIVSDSMTNRTDPKFKFSAESHLLKYQMNPHFISINEDIKGVNFNKQGALIGS
jgi:competence protein ComEC